MKDFFVLGGLFLVTAWLLFRGARRRAESALRNSPVEVQSEPRSQEMSDTSRLRELEVRLHEYGREVEAHMQTRIAVLDRLLREADREIIRLTRLLERQRIESAVAEAPAGSSAAEGSGGPDILLLPGARPGRERRHPADTPLTPAQRQMLRHLAEAGYSPEQLAGLLSRPLATIRAALAEDLRDAA